MSGNSVGFGTPLQTQEFTDISCGEVTVYGDKMHPDAYARALHLEIFSFLWSGIVRFAVGKRVVVPFAIVNGVIDLLGNPHSQFQAPDALEEKSR